MRATVTLLALRRRLNALVEEVAHRGLSLLVTRYGRPYVRIEPVLAEGPIAAGLALDPTTGETLAAPPVATGDLENSAENSQKTPEKRSFPPPRRQKRHRAARRKR